MIGQRKPRSEVSSGIDIGLGGIAPILAAAALVAVRGHVANTNVALILAVVVVALGALGGRAAGTVAGLTAALSFDFFHTRPYLSLLIHDADDVEMTILLLILGLVSGQLAWKAGVAARQRDGGRGGLEHIRRVADLVAHGGRSVDVIATTRTELIDLFQLVDCQFEAAPFDDRIDLPHLERTGVVAHRRYRLQPGGELEVELPAEGIALPVMSRGQIVGRFILDFGPSAGATLEQRIVAIALADQVGASLAAYPVGSAARSR
jgi:K+-sensing histidine kinase KdpD